MLSVQHNGLANALGDETEVDVLQNLACTIGPRVDGVAAGMALPQAMGGFSTYGARMACAGRDQQQEQHTPTTTRGLGQTDVLAPATTAAKIALPSTFMSKLIAVRDTSAVGPLTTGIKTAAEPLPVAPPSDVIPTPLPGAQAYPPGTITAFNANTNMWRVAIPVASTGLGIFGATAAFTEVAPTQAPPPPGATQVSQAQFEKQTGTRPVYKKLLFWVAVAGGAVVLGGGGYLLFRKRA